MTHCGQSARDVQLKGELLLIRQGTHALDDGTHRFRQVEGRRLQHHSPRFEAREVQNVVQDTQQMLRAVMCRA
jgi:hypothetical protein